MFCEDFFMRQKKSEDNLNLLNHQSISFWKNHILSFSLIQIITHRATVLLSWYWNYVQVFHQSTGGGVLLEIFKLGLLTALF